MPEYTPILWTQSPISKHWLKLSLFSQEPSTWALPGRNCRNRLLKIQVFSWGLVPWASTPFSAVCREKSQRSCRSSETSHRTLPVCWGSAPSFSCCFRYRKPNYRTPSTAEPSLCRAYWRIRRATIAIRCGTADWVWLLKAWWRFHRQASRSCSRVCDSAKISGILGWWSSQVRAASPEGEADKWTLCEYVLKSKLRWWVQLKIRTYQGGVWEPRGSWTWSWCQRRVWPCRRISLRTCGTSTLYISINIHIVLFDLSHKRHKAHLHLRGDRQRLREFAKRKIRKIHNKIEESIFHFTHIKGLWTKIPLRDFTRESSRRGPTRR